VKLHIRNDSDHTVTYSLGHTPALATDKNTFLPGFWDEFATVTFDAPTLTLKKHEKKDVAATISGLSNPEARLFGGYLTVTPDDGSPITRVPYAGYNGDYQAIQALVPTDYGFPWLAKVSGGYYANQPAGASYTMTGNDIPYILLHLDHQVRTLQIEVVNVATGESEHFAEDDDYLPRNSSNTGFFAFPWDGTTFKKDGKKPKALPNGDYKIMLSVLKALGDKKDPAHTETWESPTITIARP
jgi:minor extracellular serine protease Vpr